MTVRLLVAAAVAAGLAAPAQAQFRPEPMRIPIPRNVAPLAAPLVRTGPASDLLLYDVSRLSPARLCPWRNLLACVPFAFPADPDDATAGSLLATAGPADIAVVPSTLGAPQVRLLRGTDRTELDVSPYSGQPPTVTAARLLPGAPQLLVAPIGTVAFQTDRFEAAAIDTAGLATTARWSTSTLNTQLGFKQRILTVRLSSVARALGIDDLVLPETNELQLVAHGQDPQGSVAGLETTMVPVLIGNHSDPTPFLPPGVAGGFVLGAAAADVDGDGIPDLVFPLTSWGPKGTAPRPGVLVSAKNVGDPAQLASVRPWENLTGRPELQPLQDPVTVSQVAIGGAPAAAVWDRENDAVLVIWTDPAGGALRVWRGSAGGLLVAQFQMADVVGSPAPDLIALAWTPDAAQYFVLVWPDAGDPGPQLAWSRGDRGPATRGEDWPMAVAASGAQSIDWALSVGADAWSASGAEVIVPGARLCTPSPPPLVGAVRAIDDLGVFAELSASVDVILGGPSIEVAGVAAHRLVLLPGGTRVTLEGEAWPGCGGPVTFTWSATGMAAPDPAQVSAPTATSTRWDLVLPEAAYPALLAGAPSVSLTAVDPLAQPATTTATLDLDASGLAGIETSADRATVGAGDVAVLRVTLSSRIGVALPSVRVVNVLDGLVPAGPPAVRGASIVEVRSGGAELVIDALPPAGAAAVTIDLPVRGTGAPSAAAAEARSSGGYLLTPPARTATPSARLPGCGCSSGGGGPALAVLALLALLRVRKRTRTRTRTPLPCPMARIGAR